VSSIAAAAQLGEPRAAVRGALVAGWAVALPAYAAAILWVAMHASAISSDDALFLTRGLTRFSVLDFSPQFPGYPGFIAMGRLLLPFAGDPVRALAMLTALMAFAVPPLAAAVAWRMTASGASALAAFALTLCQPLMPDLALSLLTDGAGIAFLLGFLALLPRTDERPGWGAAFAAGAVLAWGLACRPSDAVLFAGGALGALAVAPRITLPAVLGGLAVAVPVALVVAGLEGGIYIDEGMRFISGHATLWGNTAFAATAHQTWVTAIGGVPGGLALAAVMIASVAVALARIRGAPPALAAATAAFILYATWVVLFQNPDQLRHLAPLVVLGGIILAVLMASGRAAMAGVGIALALEIVALAGTTATDPRLAPPLAAAASALAAEPGGALATNAGVATLRAALPGTRVYDAYYAADARLGLAEAAGPAFRLSMKPIPGMTAETEFRGRFAGEPTLRLYRIK